MSVAGAGGGADTGADTAGIHAANGWEVGVVEDGELQGQPALDAVMGREERGAHVRGSCCPLAPIHVPGACVA